MWRRNRNQTHLELFLFYNLSCSAITIYKEFLSPLPNCAKIWAADTNFGTFVSFIWKLIQVIQKHWSKRIYLILYISYENWYIQDIYVIMSKTKTYFYIIPIQYNFLFSTYIHLFIFFCRHSFVPQSRGLLKTNHFDN